MQPEKAVADFFEPLSIQLDLVRRIHAATHGRRIAQPETKGKIMQPNPVVWFEIYVQDMARAKAFYQTLLQRTLEKLNTPDTLEGGVEMWAFPMDSTAMGASGVLAKMDGCGSGGGGTPWKPRAPRRPAAACSRRSSPSASTVSSPWSTILKATSSACTR
jgi:hypothetical protein